MKDVLLFSICLSACSVSACAVQTPLIPSTPTHSPSIVSNPAKFERLISFNTLIAPSKFEFDAAGNVWMTDSRLVKLTRSGEQLKQLPADFAFSSMALDSHDNLWTADYSGKITKYDPEGSPLTSFNLHGDWNWNQIFVDHRDDLWVTGGSKRDAQGGLITLTPEIGLARSFSQDSTGNLWVATVGTHMGVVKASSDGQVFGKYAEGFNPHQIAVDRLNAVWVTPEPSAGEYPDELIRLSPEGVVVAKALFGMSAHSIVPDTEGNAWVTFYLQSKNANSIGKVSPQGELLGMWDLGDPVVGIAIDRQGILWVSQFHDKRCFVTQFAIS